MAGIPLVYVGCGGRALLVPIQIIWVVFVEVGVMYLAKT